MILTATTTSDSDARQLLQLIKRGDRVAATSVLKSLTAVTTTVPASRRLELQDDDGDGTALVWAACHGFDELVVLLLAAGAEVNASATSNGFTALHAAAERGRTSVIRSVLLPSAAFAACSLCEADYYKNNNMFYLLNSLISTGPPFLSSSPPSCLLKFFPLYLPYPFPSYPSFCSFLL